MTPLEKVTAALTARCDAHEAFLEREERGADGDDADQLARANRHLAETRRILREHEARRG